MLGEKADTRMASLAFSPDGKTLAAMDRHGHVVLWNLAEQTRLAEWKGIAAARIARCNGLPMAGNWRSAAPVA